MNNRSRKILNEENILMENDPAQFRSLKQKNKNMFFPKSLIVSFIYFAMCKH
jgi:uncharacterized membrane protein (DUF485 family)